jgi:Protein of unknown function (DUF3277)
MPLATYDPAKVLASFAGIPLNGGIAPDTFLKVERDEEGFTKQVGADGHAVRSRNNNRGGKATFTVMADSALNDALSAVANADELTGVGVGVFHVAEFAGTTLCHAENAWVQKLPAVERGKESGTVEWVLDCADLEMFIGGLAG